jgi:hypothetical protein
MLDAGKEARTLLRTLASHFRDPAARVRWRAGRSPGTDARRGDAPSEEARAFAPPQMLRALDVLNEAQAETPPQQPASPARGTHLSEVDEFGRRRERGGRERRCASSFATAPIVFPAAAAHGFPARQRPPRLNSGGAGFRLTRA